MKGLAELTAENDALVRRARDREAASIKRLKVRMKRVVATIEIRDVCAAIDAWRKAEAKRGGR